MKKQTRSVKRYEPVAGALRREIRTARRPGERLQSEHDLAKRFNVSLITLREATLILCHEGLLERRHGSGLFVSALPSPQRVAILTEQDITLPRTSYFSLRVIQQLRALCDDAGFFSQLYVGRSPFYAEGNPQPGRPVLTCPEFLEDLGKESFCGVASVATPPHASWLDPLRQRGVPVVACGGGYPYHVVSDLGEMVRSGVRRLATEGRTKIAVMGWRQSSPQHITPTEDFYHYFQAEMKAQSLHCDSDWIRHDLHPSMPGSGWEEFREIWLARSDRPDGLLICDDVLGQDVACAIVELGIRVPEELLIVTHANHGSGIEYPFPVTRMEYSPDDYARAAGTMLLDLISQKPVSNPRATISFRWIEAKPSRHTNQARHVIWKGAPA
ncbi:MAG: substrate-binding domain-containing protein [Lentisphaerae bacterium]|nr:substrate-binding domain-containing protein [Lentisphaerota bacterium]